MPFYVDDFLNDESVILMTLAERGAYVTLLAHQWKEGSIPSDKHSLARIMRVDSDEFDAVWQNVKQRFVEHQTAKKRLVNPRLDDERCKAANKSESAKRSIEARWKRNGRPAR